MSDRLSFWSRLAAVYARDLSPTLSWRLFRRQLTFPIIVVPFLLHRHVIALNAFLTAKSMQLTLVDARNQGRGIKSFCRIN